MKTDKHFFSYSRKDSSDFVQKLATDLKANGFNIWLDLQDIPVGSTWDTEIQKALTAAECIIIVLSKGAVASPNVLDEMSFALKLGKPIYPVLKDDCDVPFRIDRIQRIDFRNDYDAGLVQLIQTLDKNVTPVVTTPQKNQKKLLAFILAGLVVLALGIWIFRSSNHHDDKTTTTIIDSGKTKTDTIAGKKQVARQYKPHAETMLFSAKTIKTSYKIVDSSLVLIIHSPDYVPAVNFDVNQNKSVDSSLDRTYGITSGTLNGICAQYLITENSATPCGAIHSEASLSLLDKVYTFTIPLSEVSTAAGTSISFQFSFYNYESGRLYFPERNGFRDFTQMYTVSI